MTYSIVPASPIPAGARRFVASDGPLAFHCVEVGGVIYDAEGYAAFGERVGPVPDCFPLEEVVDG